MGKKRRKLLSIIYKVHASASGRLAKPSQAHPGAATALHVAASVGESRAAIADPLVGALVASGKLPESLGAHDVGTETRAAVMLETLGVGRESIPQVVKALLTGGL